RGGELDAVVHERGHVPVRLADLEGQARAGAHRVVTAAAAVPEPGRGLRAGHRQQLVRARRAKAERHRAGSRAAEELAAAPAGRRAHAGGVARARTVCTVRTIRAARTG